MDRIKNIKFTRKLVIKLILLSPVIAVLVYAALIRPVQVRLEQKEFQAAEAYLEEKKNEIEQLVGPANKVEKTNSCGYSSAKFSKGRLGCSTYFLLSYHISSLDEANRYLNIVEPLGINEIGRFGDRPARFTEDDSDRNIQLSQTLKKSENPDKQTTLEWLKGYIRPGCNTYYEYSKGKETVQISMVCGGQAMTEMYPVIKR